VRLQIQVNDRQLTDVGDEALAALGAHYEATGKDMRDIPKSTGMLKAELTDAADFFRVKRDGSREGVFPRRASVATYAGRGNDRHRRGDLGSRRTAPRASLSTPGQGEAERTLTNFLRQSGSVTPLLPSFVRG
jgi:hypothetical protein